jgi:hypothetical protein
MEPKVIETPADFPEVIHADGIGDDVDKFLQGDDAPPPPARKPAAPPPPAGELEDELAAPPPPPKPAPKPAPKPPEFDPMSPEALALAEPKKDEGVMPPDLLKDDEIGKLPEKKQRDAFAKERAAHKEARLRMQEMALKIQELSSKAQDAEQVAALKQQLEAKELEVKKTNEELSRIDLARSPEFKRQYDDPLNRIGQKMVQALVTEGVEAVQAQNLVRSLVRETKPSVREAALDDSVPSVKGTLLAMLNQFDEASQARAAALEKAKETASAISEAESRARLAAMTGRVDQVAEKAAQEAATLGSPYYKEVANNPEWNAGVAERKQALKGLLLSMDPEKLAPYVAEGLTAADLRRRYVEQNKKLKALEQEYQEVVGQAPRLGRVLPGERAPAPKKPAPLSGSESLEDMVEAHLMP